MIIVCFRKANPRNTSLLHGVVIAIRARPSLHELLVNRMPSQSRWLLLSKTILLLLSTRLATELPRVTRSGSAMLEVQVLAVMVAMVATIGGFAYSSLTPTRLASLLGKNSSMEKWRGKSMSRLLLRVEELLP